MKKKRARSFFTLVMAMSVTFSAVPSPAQEEQAPEAKVAVINGSVITQSDFDREMNVFKQRLAGMGRPVNETQLQALKKEVLESLVNRELLFQESLSQGIKVEEAEINEQINVLKKRFSSEDEFKNAMLSMNFSEGFLASQIKRDLAIKQFVDKQFAEKVTISDKEAKDYYDSHPDAFSKPAQVKASHILVSVNSGADEASKAAARKKIEEIQKKLKNGEDFATLAKEFSQCPSNASGGDLGYFGRGQMAKPFEDAAFALAPGETSSIVETKFGYHIIKCTDKKSETAVTYEEIKGKLQEYLKQNKVQEQVIAYIEELKKKAKVERFLPATP